MRAKLLRNPHIYSSFLVYFIQSGSVEGVLSFRNNHTFIRVYEGSMIGDMDIFLNNEKRKYCFMTKKGAELLTLSKKEFKKLLLVEYREIGKKVFQQALKKLKTYKIHYKNAVNHLKKAREKAKKVEDGETSPKVLCEFS